MMIQGIVACEGKVRLGTLPQETRERLAQLPGSWLEFAPDEGAIVVKHVQTAGCPALSAVPCELIALLDSLPAEKRAAVPGGELYMTDHKGQVLRVLVQQGEVRIQWPHVDYSRSIVVPAEGAFGGLNPGEARVCGWVRFGGSEDSGAELEGFVDRFEGLYPEGDLPWKCDCSVIHAHLKDVNVGPRELVAKLRELAEPPDSLEAEFEVTSFVPESVDNNFRISIRSGTVTTLRPAIWEGAPA